MRERPWGARVVLLMLVLAGCSTPSSVKAPSVTFGPAAATPGMSGMGGKSAMPNMPAGTAVPQTAPAAPAAGDAINIDNFSFAPTTLTVHTGSTVTWTNKDEEPHTVVADDGSFHSPGMSSQATFSYTFAKAGTFDYICSIHPFMLATVVVTQ